MNDEKIVLSFLTAKEEAKVDNIKRENPTLSNQEIGMFYGVKELDIFSYLENRAPHAYSRRNVNE